MGENKNFVIDEECKKAFMHRLSRIEGQVRGVKNMLDNGEACPDILMQVSAINAALNSLSKELLEKYFETSVVNDIKSDNYESVQELVCVLKKMMK
jgi:DNA-binding FrmR family transcriptional regulator